MIIPHIFLKIKWILRIGEARGKEGNIGITDQPSFQEVLQCISSQGLQIRYPISHRGCRMSLSCRKDENPPTLSFRGFVGLNKTLTAIWTWVLWLIYDKGVITQ